MSDKIYLRLEIIDGKKYILDQHDRVLDSVISIVSETELDSIDKLKIEVYEMREKNDCIVSGGHTR